MNARPISAAAAVQRPVEEHIAGAETLLTLLAEEHVVLAAKDTSRLPSLCREKAVLLTRLASLGALLRSPAGATIAPAQRQQIADLLSRCRHESAVNGALLQARALRARRALAAMHRAEPVPYDRAGRNRYALAPRWSGRA